MPATDTRCAARSRVTRSASRSRPRPTCRPRERAALAPAARMDGRRPAARSGRSRAPRARLRARPALSPRARQRRPGAVRARVRAGVLRTRACRGGRVLRARRGIRARRRTAPTAARHAARAPALRGRGALLAPAPARRRAHGRLGGERLDGRAQPRHQHVDVRGRRPHRAARAALRPRGAAHGRMTWIAALRTALGDRVHTLPADLAAVARDASHVIGHPEALIYPETAEHVATAVRIARDHGVPIVPRGGGTSLTGATVPTRGGLVIAFNRMKAIVALDVEERTALVQPGLPNAQLDAEARRHGLRYTPDPSSRAASVIGGNIATNAGGLHCLGHGVTADHVLGIEVVFGDGTIAWLEDTDACDLRALVTGSEGTLGI